MQPDRQLLLWRALPFALRTTGEPRDRTSSRLLDDDRDSRPLPTRRTPAPNINLERDDVHAAPSSMTRRAPRRGSTEATIRPPIPRRVSAFVPQRPCKWSQQFSTAYHFRFWKCHVALPASTASMVGSRSVAMDRLRTNPLAPASIAANSAFFSSWTLRAISFSCGK